MRIQRTVLLRRAGLLLCFLALIAVGWTCLQLRFLAEASIHISEWIVGTGYILCPGILGFGIFFTNAHQIKREKPRFASLTLALSALTVLLAGLFISLAIDYPRALEARENFRQGDRPTGSIVTGQLLSPRT